MNPGYLRGVYLRLAGVVALAVMMALALNAFLSHRSFERALAPQVATKVASDGASIRALILRAVELGVPFTELYGVNERFAEVEDEVPEVVYLAITDAQGKVLYEHKKPPVGAPQYMAAQATLDLLHRPDVFPNPARVGNQYIVSLPIVAPDQPLGLLHIGVDVRFVDAMVLDMLFDVIVVLVVSLFFTLELLHFIAGVKLDASLRLLGETFDRGAQGDFRTPRDAPSDDEAFAPLMLGLRTTLARINTAFAGLARAVDDGRRVPAHERPAGLTSAQAGLQSLMQRFRFGADNGPREADPGLLVKVRAPLFVFILAEELTRSFVPAYVQKLLVPLPGISPQIVLGLPIALFMLIVAIGQPFFGLWCERVGHRRAMLTGGVVAAVGFVGSAAAFNVLDLLAWRSLCGVGYGMVFVAAQSYVLDHAPATQRASSFAIFVGAIMAAGVCGPSIGGILADNIGMRATFAVAGVLAVVSLLVMRGLPTVRPATERPPARVPKLREIGTLLLNRNFMLVTGLAAMPAKILLTGMCFYLVPLYILTVESTQAMSGRILMTYGAVMVIFAPITAALATSRERMHWLVGGGLIVSGLGGVLLLAGGGIPWVFAATVLVGAGQALSISAQSALVAEHCPREIAKMGDGVVYGVYRLLERMGNALGPMIAAGLVLAVGYRASFVVIGSCVALAGLLFLAATRRENARALAPV